MKFLQVAEREPRRNCFNFSGYLESLVDFYCPGFSITGKYILNQRFAVHVSKLFMNGFNEIF